MPAEASAKGLEDNGHTCTAKYLMSNGNSLDNRRCNLRLCTNSQNQQNQTPQGGSSEFKGVYWRKRDKKWCAGIGHNGKQYYLGLFANEIDAARAYDAAARERFGDFSRANFPKGELRD